MTANTLSVAAHTFRTDRNVIKALGRALDECNRVNGELQATSHRLANKTESDGVAVLALPDKGLQTVADRLRVALGVHHQSHIPVLRESVPSAADPCTILAQGRLTVGSPVE